MRVVTYQGLLNRWLTTVNEVEQQKTAGRGDGEIEYAGANAPSGGDH